MSHTGGGQSVKIMFDITTYLTRAVPWSRCGSSCELLIGTFMEIELCRWRCLRSDKATPQTRIKVDNVRGIRSSDLQTNGTSAVSCTRVTRTELKEDTCHSQTE